MKTKIQIVTFSGVDGAGKTTILREFKNLLETKYNQSVIELRHRPSILPILSSIKHGKKKAELKTMEALPRTGTNKSKLSSYIRFFYYLIDYIVGQWIVYFKYTKKGKIIVYDRYFFDFINDAKRTNIDLDSEFIKLFYTFIFKPDLNIFLYAPPEIILNRKKELDEKSIINLTSKYKQLFKILDQQNTGRYISLENIDKQFVIKKIEELYVNLPYA